MMFANYVLIALRRCSRERSYVLINVFSLALGIASFALLGLYLLSELTYDRHHVNHERIYRITTQFKNGEREWQRFAVSQAGLGPLLTKDYPQLGTHVRLRASTQNVFEYQDIKRQWEHVFLADPSVFEVFTHQPIYGDLKGAFADPYSIAISAKLARHYFGTENPVGKTLSGGAYAYTVRLVFADLPENTHLRYDALLPMALMDKFVPGYNKNFTNSLWGVDLYTYVMVGERFDPAEFPHLAQGFFDTYMAERSKALNTAFQANIQRLADVHFGERLQVDELVGNVFYVYGFAAIAVFILLIACINYVNLATARAAKRAREVGLRKVLGAQRPQLVVQFLGESATFVAIALLLAIGLIYTALEVTALGALMGKEQLLAKLGSPAVLLGLVGVGLLVTLLAGLYPAFYLSGMSPLAALTDVRRSWRNGLSMRQLLVFAQLSISIGVIACTLLMSEQLDYLSTRPLGFDRENRLLVTLRGYDVVKQVRTLKRELLELQGVVNVTTISIAPGTGSTTTLVPLESNAGVMAPVDVHQMSVGLNLVEAMNMQLVRGRGFSEEIATDLREAVLVNESLVKQMGWEEPVGKRVQTPRGVAKVVGVVRDFHYASLHNEIGALLLTPLSDQVGMVPPSLQPMLTTSFVVVMSGGDLSAQLNEVREVIGKFDRRFEFEPVFLEDRLMQLYQSESSLMKLIGVFAGLCILISIMGLFGLAAYTTEQRSKEISIRKVLGASGSSIVTMLVKGLLVICAVAAIPATLAGYFVIDRWLERFAYHTGIDRWTFAIAILTVTCIAVATVVLQCMKVMRSDPLQGLRHE